MSLNGTFINCNYPSPYHVTQSKKNVQNVPISGFIIFTSNKNSTPSIIPLSRACYIQPNRN